MDGEAALVDGRLDSDGGVLQETICVASRFKCHGHNKQQQGWVQALGCNTIARARACVCVCVCVCGRKVLKAVYVPASCVLCGHAQKAALDAGDITGERAAEDVKS